MGRHNRNRNRFRHQQQNQQQRNPQQQQRKPDPQPPREQTSRRPQPKLPVTKPKGIAPLGWKVILGGIALVGVGFYVLSLTDPQGRNWASNLCPFLILGGYAVIAVGIILPEKKAPSSFEY